MFTLQLNSIAFSLGPIDVHWYGIILGTAALVGLLLAVQEGKRFGLSADFFMDLLLFGVPSAIIGARLYYVAFKLDEYKDDPLQIFAVWNGGIAIYGALIGAFLCGYIYFRMKGYSFWRIADICAPSLIAGQMIGRWGNFVNQEAYGGDVEESFLRNTLHLPDWIVNQMNINGVFHHPTFLYESLWNLVGLVLLMVLRRQSFLRAGELVLSYFIWYSIGRFFVEGLRTDSLAFEGANWLASLMNGLWSPMNIVFEPGYLDAAYGNVRISQLISVLLIVAAVILIIVRRRNGMAKDRYLDPIINYKTGLPAGSAGNSGSTSAQAPGTGSADTQSKEQ
ncbi:prolipoprotein diacylglyceryl transferase [Paenibacillus methanolicus]|uniref:Phosphatidylglycerol--prolipoprotein diacylglyceryl transferase n=1 Tax=Paenibacillus methanolicus TaxID=582686 RepID=A0A5S5BSP4_9BACL|nr:prolipoprotein diacylglyceryl transferase [Paenibacillus methanolicus]TYP69212.1 phosphatidylglycerol:prolipoprotein diacylglycerol transferase [Paenibacillus methanolicus]